LCASALQHAGYKVGLYTSPHLLDYAERIQIDGQPIPHVDLTSLVDECKPTIESIPELTTFEITTGLAFFFFQTQRIDVAVVEVGLGGRLDPTNVVIPNVSVITSISIDHTKVLGNSLAEIAREKAGIIKPGTPVVLAPQKDEARQVIERIAQECHSPITQVGRDYLFSTVAHSLEDQTLQVWSADDQACMDAYVEAGKGGPWKPTQLTIPLLGFHQVENAATAYAALQVVRKTDVPIPESAIQAGFAKVSWPGRFEIVSRNPMVVIDSAHNRDSALKLRLALDDYFPGVPVVLLFAASEDKDVDGMFAELLPRVRQVIVTKTFHPRGLEPEVLAEKARRFGLPVHIIPIASEALQTAMGLVNDGSVLLTAGSLFLSAEVLDFWSKRINHEK
jgi:dihydrofolate synthase/folylpolyglutamate synthase